MSEAETKDLPREVRLSTGETVSINLNAITWGEYHELAQGVDVKDPDNVQHNRHAYLLGKTVGLEQQAMTQMGAMDYHQILQRVHALYRNAVEADPS